ncbi:IS30 family transposase [candidate division KSB1 bacterium]|nr:IS30 family transposase [candidate division KSB1 bacterium]MBL7095327.1 IS30 family transposase [candidate division KSB1 bacterium]
MMSYKQLTYEQRNEIHALLKAHLNQTKIAKLIGVNKSTISRDIKRNTGLKGYRPKQANQRALERRQNADKHVRFTDQLKADVIQYLKQDWSPEQISGWLKKNNKPFVSHETIYQFIIDDQKDGGELYKHLRSGRKKRRKRIKSNDRRGQIPNRVSIDKRPAVVDNKLRVGDWEIDTIIGRNHKGALVTAVERKTKVCYIKQVPKKEAALVTKAIVDMLKPFENLVHTLTSDNGKEFSEHEKIAKALQAQSYFAHPFSSWERGLNENTNGLIRQYFPKKTSLVNIDKEQVMAVQNKLNNRPRKTIDFQKPCDIFFNSFVALGT